MHLQRSNKSGSFESTVTAPFRIKTNKPGGGYSWEFLVGVCRLVLQILTLFQTKNVIFHTPFQTRPLKSIPGFRPGL